MSMGWQDFSSYFRNTAMGQGVLYNAIAGCALGLHSHHAVRQFGRAAIRSWIGLPSADRTSRKAQAILNDQRFSRGEPRGVLAGNIGLPRYNAYNAGSDCLSHVMKISNFGYFIHPDDQHKLENDWQLVFPDNAT
jgi:hypothetical protein